MTENEIVETAIQGHASTRDAIRLAIQQEREACAKLCESFYRHGNWITKEEAAAAIRARGVVHASDISQERVDETGKDRHEPESNDVEIAAEQSDNYAAFLAGVRFARVNLLKEKNGG